MKFSPAHRKLKNGKTITIRQCVPEDAAALLETVRTYIGQSDYLLTTPEEFNLTEAEEERWIGSFTGHESSLLLVAEYEGRIVGNIDLTGGRKNRIKHTSLIGIGMLKEWQGVGLGTALFGCAISWAKEASPIRLLWLQCISENEAGMTLYLKAGFTECGRQPHYFRLSENRYADNVIMSLSL